MINVFDKGATTWIFNDRISHFLRKHWFSVSWWSTTFSSVPPKSALYHLNIWLSRTSLFPESTTQPSSFSRKASAAVRSWLSMSWWIRIVFRTVSLSVFPDTLLTEKFYGWDPLSYQIKDTLCYNYEFPLCQVNLLFEHFWVQLLNQWKTVNKAEARWKWVRQWESSTDAKNMSRHKRHKPEKPAVFMRVCFCLPVGCMF